MVCNLLGTYVRTAAYTPLETKRSTEKGIKLVHFSLASTARGNIFPAHAPFDFPQKASSWQTSALRPLRKAKRLTFQYQSSSNWLFLFRPYTFHSLCVALVLMASAHPSMHLFIARWAARAHNSEFIFRSRPRLFSEGATWRQTYNSAAAAFLSFHFQYEIKMRVIMPPLAPYCARNSFWIFKDSHSLCEERRPCG